MITLLEFVCEQLMGPPTQRKGNGDSNWPCPKCAHKSFHTLPDVPDKKHRCRCFRCDFRGDVFDVLWFFHPRETYTERQSRLANLTEDYEREVVQAASDTPNQAHTSSLRGSGITDKKVALMWANLSEKERVAFAEVAEIADRYEMDIGLVGPLAKYSAGFIAYRASFKVPCPHPVPHKPNLKRVSNE